MNSPFVTNELDDALTMLKLRKAPGPDNITNEMLLHIQLLGKIGLLRTKSPISPKLLKMPSKTRSIHLHNGLT